MSLMILGIAGYLYFQWWYSKTREMPPSKEEATAFLKGRVEIRSQQKYFEQLIPIYEKIIQENPKNEEAKKELANILEQLQKLR